MDPAAGLGEATGAGASEAEAGPAIPVAEGEASFQTETGGLQPPANVVLDITPPAGAEEPVLEAAPDLGEAALEGQGGPEDVTTEIPGLLIG